MEEKDLSFINDCIYSQMLHLVPDSLDAGSIADKLTQEVADDVAETAGPIKWHSGDVAISLARVLKKVICGE